MSIAHGRLLVGGVALMAGMAMMSAAQATPPSGVVGTPLVRSSFTDDVSAKFTVSYGNSTIVSNAKDASQVVHQSFTFDPGGQTGWHSHWGPVVVTVMSGTLTYYDGSGPCIGRHYPAGTSFLEPGMGNVHIARNEAQ